MESPNNKYEKQNDLKNIIELYNKFKNHESTNKKITADLAIFEISIDKDLIKPDQKIILLEKLMKTIYKYKDNTVEVYYYTNNKILIYSKNNIEIIIKNIISNLDQNNIDINKQNYKTNISYAKVNYPQDGIKYSQIIEKLEDKLKKDKEEFKFPSPPDAIKINKKNDYIDKIEKTSTQYYLIAKNENIEIIRQDILANKSLQISAGDKDNFELFYILKGKLSTKNNEILYPGDSITAKSGDQQMYLETLTDSTLIYLTSTPIFSSYQKRIQKLFELNYNMAKKDIETQEHCDRLQNLSRIVGIELGLDEKKLFNLGFASFLHDIGKSNVPAEILLKPDKLNKKEWEIMKKHTAWGRELITDFFKENEYKIIGTIINQHHERYDGAGYPNGIKENQILIEAQILSVVDAYDAMTNDRPYQKAITKEKAIEEIKSQKGKQFSPKVVDAFVKAIKKYNDK